MRRVALVTGASSGIGAAFAEALAARDTDVIVVARRLDRLETLRDRLQERHAVRVHVVQSDLSCRGAVDAICAELDRRGLVVDILVNNAGFGVSGRLVASPWQTHEAFLQVMIGTVAELTHRVMPGMIERRFGRIINVASLAALLPAPAGHTMYAASKAFVVKFSEALALEGRPHGVLVTALCPGFTWSEFHDVVGTRESVSRMPSFMWTRATDVAERGLEAVELGASVVVVGRFNATLATLARLLPQSVVRAVSRRVGRSYRKV